MMHIIFLSNDMFYLIVVHSFNLWVTMCKRNAGLQCQLYDTCHGMIGIFYEHFLSTGKGVINPIISTFRENSIQAEEVR